MDAIEQNRVDLVEGIIGRKGILENRLDVLPIVAALALRADIALDSLEIDLALADTDQPQEHFGQGGLATARFTNNRDDFALIEVEIDMVHRNRLLAPKAKDFGHAGPA